MYLIAFEERNMLLLTRIFLTFIIILSSGYCIRWTWSHDVSIKAFFENKLTGWEVKQRHFLSGQLEKYQSDAKKIVVVRFGGFNFTTNYSTLAKFNFRDYYDFEYDYPMAIKIHDGRLLVTAWFNDRSGNMIAKIIDNEWKINPDNYFDRNFDNNGFEVVDQNKIPVLQVHIADGNKILIGGVFYYPETRLVMPFDGQSDISKKPARYDMKTLKEKMKPLFEYPSDKQIGKRASLQPWTDVVAGIVIGETRGGGRRTGKITHIKGHVVFK